MRWSDRKQRRKARGSPARRGRRPARHGTCGAARAGPGGAGGAARADPGARRGGGTGRTATTPSSVRWQPPLVRTRRRDRRGGARRRSGDPGRGRYRPRRCGRRDLVELARAPGERGSRRRPASAPADCRRGLDGLRRRRAALTSPQAAPPPPPAALGKDTGTSSRAGAAPLPSANRAQDYSASIKLHVDDPDELSEAVQSAIRSTRALGGYVTYVDYGTSGAREGEATLAVRVPVGRVQTAVARFSQLGTILEQQTEIVDLQGRIDRITQRHPAAARPDRPARGRAPGPDARRGGARPARGAARPGEARAGQRDQAARRRPPPEPLREARPRLHDGEEQRARAAAERAAAGRSTTRSASSRPSSACCCSS